MQPVVTPDIVIAGAGIIGLSTALELQHRGASVAILDTAAAASGASSAAAGMLAAEDPHNPAELREFSLFSLSLYDGFLERVASLSGLHVPYQTTSPPLALLVGSKGYHSQAFADGPYPVE